MFGGNLAKTQGHMRESVGTKKKSPKWNFFVRTFGSDISCNLRLRRLNLMELNHREYPQPDSAVDSIHVQPRKTLKIGEDLPARFGTTLVNGGNSQITGVAGM
jgi:hypothetical protein